MKVMSSISRLNSASSTPPSPCLGRSLPGFPAVHVPERAELRMSKVKSIFKPQIVILVTVSIVFLCFAAAASAMTDPRLCGNTSKPTCGGTAARKALTLRITHTLHPVGQVIPACHPLTANMLRYECLAHDAGGHTWKGWVTFKHLAAGWHTYVTVRPVNG